MNPVATREKKRKGRKTKRGGKGAGMPMPPGMMGGY